MFIVNFLTDRVFQQRFDTTDNVISVSNIFYLFDGLF